MNADPESMKILVAVEGRGGGTPAAQEVLRLLRAGLVADVHLLNVQPAIESGHSRMFVSDEEVEAWYREEGLAALADSRRLFDDAGIACQPHVAVGHAAETIRRFAEAHAFDLLVIGAGASALTTLIPGAVAGPLLKHAELPVLVAR
ncbi:MAG: universal stress protein [Rhodocyclaceae bacterium]|nr:universal stress protein [Rhodocyclaceae bacterium]